MARWWLAQPKGEERIWQRWHRKGLRGVTAARYAQLLAHQEGGCAICKHPPKGRRLTVDHDVSGEVRGLVCSACYSRLGVIEPCQQEGLLIRVVEYLNRPLSPPPTHVARGPSTLVAQRQKGVVSRVVAAQQEAPGRTLTSIMAEVAQEEGVSVTTIQRYLGLRRR